MHKRHSDRATYFKELAFTCEKYYIPYISQFVDISPDLRVLEVGCGDGGNLLPFARCGCRVTGVDLAACRINDAISFFAAENATGEFIAADIFSFTPSKEPFDIIICHDVIEHIMDKERFLLRLKDFLSEKGVLFISFPAWQMPFGGHQQICKNRVLSHLPFIHLLPSALYRMVLKASGEADDTIAELLSIKQTRCPIERFLNAILHTNSRIVHQQLYFINPHYEIKFSLKPLKLWPLIGRIPYIRNIFTTSCFYIIR